MFLTGRLGGIGLLGEAILLRWRRGSALSAPSLGVLLGGAAVLLSLSWWMLDAGFSRPQ